MFSVVACLKLNLGAKSAQNCNADVSSLDLSGPYREKLDWATANQGTRFLRILDRKKINVNIFHKKTDKTQKYLKPTIFAWYKNGCRQLLGVQSINTERASGNIYHISESVLHVTLGGGRKKFIMHWISRGPCAFYIQVGFPGK